MSHFLVWASSLKVWVLAAITLVVVLLVWYVVRLIRKAAAPADGLAPEPLRGEAPEAAQAEARAGEPEAVASTERPRIGGLDLRQSFKEALRSLRAYGSVSGVRYRVPWFATIGAEGCGKAALLESGWMSEAVESEPAYGRGDQDQLRWFFFDQAVVIDVPSHYVLDRSSGQTDTAAWTRFLKLLNRYRSARPLEGVILAISCEDLELRDAADERALRDTGRQLFDRMAEMKRRLGLQLPVYVVLTKADRLPGFTDFHAALPPEYRQEILGWSSPYPVDAAFDAKWTREAVDAMVAGLRGVEGELAVRTDVSGAERLLHFSGHLAALARPLEVLLGEVFRDTLYHEGFFVRGIYLAGAQADPAGQGDPGSQTLRVGHVRDLFARKVFRERGLVRVHRRGVLSRERKVRAFQIGVAVFLALGIGGSAWGRWRMKQQAQPVMALLIELERGLSAVSTGDGNPDVFELLEGMANISASRIWSPFVPASWFSGLHEAISDRLVDAFQLVILPTIRRDLLARADSLTRLAGQGAGLPAGAPAAAGPAGAPSVAAPSTAVSPVRVLPAVPGDLPAYHALLGDLAGIAALSDNVRRFNALAQEDNADLTMLRDLVGYVFHEQLPPDFLKHADYYRRALRAATEEEIGPDVRPDFAKRTAEHLRVLTEGVYRQLWTGVEAFALQYGQLNRPDPSDPPTLDDLRGFSSSEAAVEAFLEALDPRWFASAGPLPDDVSRLIPTIQEAGFVQAAELARAFSDVFRQTRANESARLDLHAQRLIRIAGAPVVVVATDSVQVALAPDLRGFNVALSRILASPVFVSRRAEAAPSTGGSGTRPMWNPRPLDQVLALFDELRAFDQATDSTLSRGLAVGIQMLLGNALASRVDEALDQAMTYELAVEPAGRAGIETALKTRLRSFDEAAKRLVQLIELGNRYALPGIPERVSEVLVLEALDLLDQCDRLVDAIDPYAVEPDALAHWRIGRPMAFDLFGAGSSAELEAYLTRQRTQIAAVARSYAAKVLGYFDLPAVAEFLRFNADVLGPDALKVLERWRGIVATVDQYDAGTPGNDLARLETLVRQDLMSGSTDVCVEPPRWGGRGTSFFAARAHALLAEVGRQCRSWTASALLDRYRTLRTRFDGALAGRFPFSEDPMAPREATLTDVAAVLDTFAAFESAAGARAAELIATLDGGAESAAFLRSMAQVREVLTPLLRTTPPPPAKGKQPVKGARPARALGYRVDFRVNREAERGGDQVIDWRLKVGDRTAALGDSVAARAGLWRPGAPVELRLRWADQSPVAPLAPPDRAATLPDPLTVAYRYGGRWALFRMLAARSAGAYGSSGVLLRSDVPVHRRDDARSRAFASAPDTTRLYLAVALEDPATGEALSVPSFPFRAPAVGASGPARTPPELAPRTP